MSAMSKQVFFDNIPDKDRQTEKCCVCSYRWVPPKNRDKMICSKCTKIMCLHCYVGNIEEPKCLNCVFDLYEKNKNNINE